jgi:hypothetical protein
MSTKGKLTPRAANFQVDTRIAVLLGDSYQSTERALKELVDNAWDADADHVWITLPEPMTAEPVVIRDDGAGMTEQEVRQEYLFIANDRRSRKGQFTPQKKRRVKGRKGVGKFAGLSAARTMALTTRARGVETSIIIDRQELEGAGKDIERVKLPVQRQASQLTEHGTTISLSELDQNLHFPTVDRLRPLLMRDYGREEGFAITINGKMLDMDDLGGAMSTCEEIVSDVGLVKLRLAVTGDKGRIKGAGIVVRVQGRAVSHPTFFGLDSAEDFPRSLLGQIYGEVEADGLANDLTGDFSSIVENSKSFERLQAWIAPLIREKVSAVHNREMQLAQARLRQKINRRLAELPENKREFANVAITKLLRKFYGESEERLEPVVNVVLDALEHDNYYLVLRKIDEAQHSDVAHFAEALDEFGLVDLAQIATQARQRLRFLDFLDQLQASARTDEMVMHKAIEQNLWLLGGDYGLLASNKSLRAIVEKTLNKIYTGNRGGERPDLLLASNVSQRHLVIEFKRPDMSLSFDHYQQATKYRHELGQHLPGTTNVLIVGGKINGDALPMNREPGVDASSYSAVIANARIQIDWLLRELAA